MDICIAADENYALILQTLMVSVIENNKDIGKIYFHIFECGMTRKTLERIKNLTYINNANVKIYNIDEKIKEIKNKIVNDWAEHNSYVSYARLYMPILLPSSIKKFLYLDCDTLVNGSLKQLFDVDISRYIVAGVKDILPFYYKKYKGDLVGNYINAGVLLVNNELWKEENVTFNILNYCEQHENDAYPDQDAINVVLRDKIFILPPQYCMFCPENFWRSKWQIRGYGDKNKYYKIKELDDAKQQPIIIHFVDNILGRPWQSNNINPYTELWMKYYDLIKEKDNLIFKEKILSRKQKIFRVMYKVLPQIAFSKIYYARRNRVIKKKIRKDN